MVSNRLKAVVVATGLALAAGTVSAPPASAATISPAPAAVVGQQMDGMSFYDDFWSLEECLKVGKAGLNAGKWWTFTCEESWIDYDLYVAWN